MTLPEAICEFVEGHLANVAPHLPPSEVDIDMPDKDGSTEIWLNDGFGLSVFLSRMTCTLDADEKDEIRARWAALDTGGAE